MLGPEVDQHVLPREVGLRERRIGRVGDAKGYPDGLPPVVQAGSRKLELHGALAHSEWGSLPRSPRRSRSLISAGSSSYADMRERLRDRKSTRLNSSHRCISYAVFCLKKKNQPKHD